MKQAVSWLRAHPTLAGWLACGALAALFLAPAIAKGGFGPGDLLLSMTPWSAYRDRFPDIQGVANPQLDVIQQYFPWRMFAADCLRHGVLPLWNPHAYCGQPFVGNVLSAVFYPFGWLAAGLGIGRFFLLSAWLHLTIAGGGMWMLLRAHRLRWFSALGGAVVMMFNGFVVGWLAYAPLSQWTFAWAPLVLWSWHRAWAAGRPGGLALTALLLGQVALGGHVQIAFAVGLAWCVYAAGYLAADRWWRAVPLWIVAPAAVAGLIAAVQMLPAYEMAGWSGRTGQTYAGAVASRLPWSMAITLLVPDFFGHNALHLPVMLQGQRGEAAFWGPYPNAIEASVSAGATALWLSLCAVLWRPGRAVGIFAGIAVLGLLLGFGTPVYRLFYTLVPGFSSLSGLGRWFCLWCLGAAALSGFGLEALAAGRLAGPCPKRVGLGMIAVCIVSVLLAFVGETATDRPLTAFTPGLSGFVVGRCAVAMLVTVVVAAVAMRLAGPHPRHLVLLVVLLAEPAMHGFRMHPGIDPNALFFATPETEYLQAHAGTSRIVGVPVDAERGFLDWFPQNTPMAFGLSSPTGSESLSIAAYRDLLSAFCEPGWRPRLESPLMDLVGVRFAVSRLERLPVGWPRVGGERVGVFENPDALPVIFGTQRWQLGADDAALTKLTAPDLDLSLVLLPPDAPAPAVDGARGWMSLDVQRPTPQRWLAAGHVDHRTAVVLTSPTGAGWSAWQEQREARIWPAYGVFGAVLCDPGPVSLRWVFRPLSLRLGLFCSLLAAAILAAWTSAGREIAHERAATGPADP